MRARECGKGVSIAAQACCPLGTSRSLCLVGSDGARVVRAADACRSKRDRPCARAKEYIVAPLDILAWGTPADEAIQYFFFMGFMYFMLGFHHMNAALITKDDQAMWLQTIEGKPAPEKGRAFKRGNVAGGGAWGTATRGRSSKQRVRRHGTRHILTKRGNILCVLDSMNDLKVPRRSCQGRWNGPGHSLRPPVPLRTQRLQRLGRDGDAPSWREPVGCLRR